MTLYNIYTFVSLLEQLKARFRDRCIIRLCCVVEEEEEENEEE